MNGIEFIQDLRSRGRCTFTTDEVVQKLAKTRAAANALVRRLREKGRVATPVRGFHVVVPPEYRSLRCLPPREFVPFLMEYLQREFYVGLLSAAAYHGAAHQQPQTFQTMVDDIRREVECGRVRIEFHERSGLSEVPIQRVNTDYSQIPISTPEATACDLAGFEGQIGGLDRVATVLVELGDDIDAARLCEIGPQIAPDAWLQRLGYLLDTLGFEEKTGPLADFVAKHVSEVTPLRPERNGRTGKPRDRKWLVAINHRVDPDI